MMAKTSRDDGGRWAVMSPIQGDVYAPYVISEHSSRKAAVAAKRRVSWAKRPYVKRLNPGVARKGATSRKRKNPVRIGATLAGKSTGWIKSKSVRVRKVKGKGYVVDVKR